MPCTQAFELYHHLRELRSHVRRRDVVVVISEALRVLETSFTQKRQPSKKPDKRQRYPVMMALKWGAALAVAIKEHAQGDEETRAAAALVEHCGKALQQLQKRRRPGEGERRKQRHRKRRPIPNPPEQPPPNRLLHR